MNSAVNVEPNPHTPHALSIALYPMRVGVGQFNERNLILVEEHYVFTDDSTMKREGPNLTWFLRDADGDVLDRDQYRHDILNRCGLTVRLHHNPDHSTPST